jgi:DNA-binding NarL/FixJ family response regulator
MRCPHPGMMGFTIVNYMSHLQMGMKAPLERRVSKHREMVRKSGVAPITPIRERVAEMAKPSTSRIRILIVDDHPILREGLVTIIESQSDLSVVGEAATGKEAIALFEEHVPDITLMDLGLPDVNGIDVITTLRETHPDARIIVLTTYLGDVQAIRALRAGASGYLLKATLRRDLLDSIRAVHAGLRHVQAEVATELGQHATDPSLTTREVEVLKLIAKGSSNKVVADQLNISEETVKGHVRSILYKLKANDRTHAVAIALHRGFFEL